MLPWYPGEVCVVCTPPPQDTKKDILVEDAQLQWWSQANLVHDGMRHSTCVKKPLYFVVAVQ